MFKLAIVSTNIFAMENEPKAIEISDFNLLVSKMQVGQFIRFQLWSNHIDVDGVDPHPLIEESYLKHSEEFAFADFISQALSMNVKKKKINKKIMKAMMDYFFAATEEKQRPVKKEKQSNNNVKIVVSRKYMAILFLCILLLPGSYYLSQTTLFSANEVISEKTDTFERNLELLSEKEIGQLYPEKWTEIIHYYVENQLFEKLDRFHSYYHTEQGAAELAFYHEEWERVIASELTLSNERYSVMLVHAFIQLNRLEEAELVNQQLNSEILQDVLDQAYFNQAMDYLREKEIENAQKISQKIMDQSMVTILEQQIDHAAIIIQLIQFYSENSDADNQAIWERKLALIGKE
ncbi:hypothetical protein [Enterococcus casseliflavus]|uniref:hypothetical protein n=1 Tax=Enterococcus casseliflavus TaxID=37734 RepID=UPI0034D36570